MKINGLKKWLPWILVIGGIIWNSAILHNDVKHLKTDIAEIKQDVRDILQGH
jgi:hypothetical protein